MPLGGPEILVIVVLVLLLFGPDKLPELARGLGKGMRELRKVTSEFQSQLSALADMEDEGPRRPPAGRRPAPQPRQAPRASSRPSGPAVQPDTSAQRPAAPEPDAAPVTGMDESGEADAAEWARYQAARAEGGFARQTAEPVQDSASGAGSGRTAPVPDERPGQPSLF